MWASATKKHAVNGPEDSPAETPAAATTPEPARRRAERVQLRAAESAAAAKALLDEAQLRRMWEWAPVVAALYLVYGGLTALQLSGSP